MKNKTTLLILAGILILSGSLSYSAEATKDEGAEEWTGWPMPDKVKDIQFDDDVVWVSFEGASGLKKFENNQWINVLGPNNTTTYFVDAFSVDDEENKWVAIHNERNKPLEIYEYNNTNWTKLPELPVWADPKGKNVTVDKVYSILKDTNTNIWVAVRSPSTSYKESHLHDIPKVYFGPGLYEYNGHIWESYDEVKNGTDIKANNDGSIWLSANNGLWKYDGNYWVQQSTEQVGRIKIHPVSNEVLKLTNGNKEIRYVDREKREKKVSTPDGISLKNAGSDNAWFDTTEELLNNKVYIKNGLYKYDGNSWIKLSPPHGNDIDYYACIDIVEIDNQGNKWISGYFKGMGNGIYRLADNKDKPIRAVNKHKTRGTK